jgi:potassium-dependent mechanosensitive channel
MKNRHYIAPCRAFLLYALTAIFLAVIVPAAGFTQSKQPDSASWEEMIKREKIALNSLYANVKTYIAAQPERIGKIHEQTQQLNQELLRLSITYNMVEANPVEMRDTLRQMIILQEHATAMVTPVNEEYKAIMDLKKTLSSHQAEYESLSRQDSLQEARKAASEHAADIKKVVALLNTAAGIIDIIPNAVEEFSVRLEAKKKSVENDLRGAWKKYYLFPAMSTFFAAGTWKALREVVINLSGFWDYWLIPYIQNDGAIGKALAKTSLYAAGMICLFLVIFFRIRKKYPAIPARRFLVFGIYMSIGLPLMVLGTTTGMGILAPASFIAEIVLAAGLVSLGWNLRRIFAAGPIYRHNPLWPVWLMFTAGTMFEVCHTPTIIYSLPMTVIFLVTGMYSFFMKKGDQNDLDKRLFLGNFWLSSLFVVLTLLGWGGIAVLAATAWFAVAVNVELWSGLAGWLRKMLEAGTENMAGARRLYVGVFFPMVFLGLFSVTIIWIILYIGGTPLRDDIVRWHLDIGYLSLNIPMLIVIIAILVITRSLVILINTVITFVATRLGGGGMLQEGVIKSLHAIATYVAWSLSILVSLKLIGVSVTHLAIVAGGLSIGAGFGLQELIKNFFSGLILLFGRSIHPGDEIQLENIRGTVIRVNIRNTIMQTNDDSTIFIPNSDLINKNIINWTYRDPKGRAEIAVAVAYGSNTELVKDILVRCADSNPGVLKDPSPYVLFWDFGDNALAFRLRYWIRRPVQMRDKIASAIRFEVEKTFRENNIEMAYPQQDIHIRSAEGLSPYLKP